MTKTVEDSALILSAIAGRDHRDSTSLDTLVPDYLSELESGVKGLVIGLPREYFGEGLDPEVRRITMDAVGTITAEGAEVADISLPHTEYAVPTYYLLATAEASANLERYDGVRFGHRAKNPADLYEMFCVPVRRASESR